MNQQPAEKIPSVLPAATAVTPVRPVTGIAFALGAVLLRPSWPTSPQPKACTVPSLRRMSVKLPPPLTANALEESRRSCMAAGFDAFLVKPVDFRALAATLERVCAAPGAPWRERLRAS